MAGRKRPILGLAEYVTAFVRSEIRTRGWSISDLAFRSGISVEDLTDRLSFAHPFDMDDVGRIAGAFGITPVEFFSRVAYPFTCPWPRRSDANEPEPCPL